MKTIRFLALAGSVALLWTACAQAQSGCFHSPEAPTDVLMAVGAAGMFYGSSLVRKWTQRRRGR